MGILTGKEERRMKNDGECSGKRGNEKVQRRKRKEGAKKEQEGRKRCEDREEVKRKEEEELEIQSRVGWRQKRLGKKKDGLHK